MAGKYAKFKGQLPKFIEPASDDRKLKLLNIKDNIKQRAASKLAEKYEVVRLQKEMLKDKASEVQLELDAITELLIQAYEDEGITSLTMGTGTGASVRVQVEPYPQVHDREAFRQWCIDEQLERSMHLHSATTSALVKERLINGKPEPPGVKTFMKDKIVYSKGG